mgnify:CR=1 FL=1
MTDPGTHFTAAPGDAMIIHGHVLGHPDRKGEILEARGDHGGPPYMVRWDESGHITLFYPGTDCTVEHATDHRVTAA